MEKTEACLALAPLAELMCVLSLLRLDRDDEPGSGRARVRARGVDVDFSSGAPVIFFWEVLGEGAMNSRTMGAYLGRWSLSMETGAPCQNEAFANVAWSALDAMRRLGEGGFVAAKAACAAFKPKVEAGAPAAACLGAQECLAWMAMGLCPINKSASLLLAPAGGQDAGARAAMEAAVLREVAGRIEAPASPYAMRL